MPVLGEDDVFEAGGQGVDQGENLVSLGDGEGTAGHEVDLKVDEEESVGSLVDLHGSLDAPRGLEDHVWGALRCIVSGYGKRLG